MKQSICCSETEPEWNFFIIHKKPILNLPKERERHSCKMPDGMGVDDPVDGREVKKLKSHTGGDQENSSNPVLYVPTIRPESWSPGLLKPNHMMRLTCAGKTRPARKHSWDHQRQHWPSERRWWKKPDEQPSCCSRSQSEQSPCRKHGEQRRPKKQRQWQA